MTSSNLVSAFSPRVIVCFTAYTNQWNGSTWKTWDRIGSGKNRGKPGQETGDKVRFNYL